MPIFEYQCQICSNVFSKLQWKTSTENDIACPDCGSHNIRRLISRFASMQPTQVQSGSCNGGGRFK